MFMSEKVKVPGGAGATERPGLPGRPPRPAPATTAQASTLSPDPTVAVPPGHTWLLLCGYAGHPDIEQRRKQSRMAHAPVTTHVVGAVGGVSGTGRGLLRCAHAP